MRQAVTHPPPVDILVLWHRATGGGPWWWRAVKRWLHPDYGHVSCAWLDPGAGCWVRVDPLFGGIRIETLPGHLDVVEIARYDGATARCVVFARPRLYDGWRVRGLITCVSVVKAIAGLDGWSVTPQQLLRQCERMCYGQGGERDRGGAAQGGQRGQAGAP